MSGRRGGVETDHFSGVFWALRNEGSLREVSTNPPPKKKHGMVDIFRIFPIFPLASFWFLFSEKFGEDEGESEEGSGLEPESMKNDGYYKP